MKGTDHLQMPELINSEYPVYLDVDEREKYEAMASDLVINLPGGEVTAANAATLSGKLTQMANGAVYSDAGGIEFIHDKKLDALRGYHRGCKWKEHSGAYWYKHDLTRIIDRLEALSVKYGKLDSDQSIEDWNAGRLEVGLIHPASAGHGLNLQSGGNTLVWFGMIWSLELYQQTVARL